LAIKGNHADIYITGGQPLTLSDVVLSADTDRKVFSITDKTKRFWVPESIVPSLNGTPLTAGSYDINYAGGQIICHTALGAGTVTVDGAYFATSKLGEGKEWSVDPTVDTVECSVFGDDWKRYKPIMRGASGSISRWWVDGYFADNMDALIGLDLKTDNTSGYVCYVLLTKDSIKAAVAGLIEESLDFTVSGHVLPY
jgi:hypothetical protein